MRNIFIYLNLIFSVCSSYSQEYRASFNVRNAYIDISYSKDTIVFIVQYCHFCLSDNDIYLDTTCTVNIKDNTLNFKIGAISLNNLYNENKYSLTDTLKLQKMQKRIEKKVVCNSIKKISISLFYLEVPHSKEKNPNMKYHQINSNEILISNKEYSNYVMDYLFQLPINLVNRD